MNIASVRLFLEVADAGSLSKVAARRQTVQSHISRQVSDFESTFGGPLFRRTGRGVALTELGARAALRLRAWVQETERLTEDLRAESGKVLGEVRMGIIPSAAHPLVTRLFEHLQREHPGIRLNIAEAQGTEIDAMLDSGAVDLAILFRFNRPGGREEKLLSVAHTYLVAAPGDALTREPAVPFARLAGLRLVLPRRPGQWRHALDEAARGLGFRLESVAEVDSLTVQKELVAQTPGLYSVLGPYSMSAELQSGRLQASQLVKPDLVRHTTLALPRQGKLSAATRVVAEVVQQLVGSWGNRLSEPAPAAHPPHSDARARRLPKGVGYSE
ncbi:MAG: LysR family transcriptional regulator [Burkholderiales bacterium]|nr:LysR family transcriptional regulator [Burkholderiales bacterium]MDE1925794.1 LysR family transcriptional regulator [Burkholderiales bacterium]MDE2157282.1 LysR family transcriptional regulator [Burkholderiales bacterium]MDE2501535.1 LysR family transcriptional regulator [Burkholderiales bacterium]